MSDKRDLFTTGFKAEDFDSMVIPAYSSNWNELIANHANVLLREALAETQTVYMDSDDIAKVDNYSAYHSAILDTHTAKLVAIKPIKGQ